jgi:hypothetical protein
MSSAICEFCQHRYGSIECSRENQCMLQATSAKPKVNVLMEDLINKAAHYNCRGGIEPIDFITSNNFNYLEGNIIKYVYRHPFKGGVETLKKARFYLDKLIKESVRL